MVLILSSILQRVIQSIDHNSMSSDETIVFEVDCIRARALHGLALRLNSETESDFVDAENIMHSAFQSAKKNPNLEVQPDIVIQCCFAFTLVSEAEFFSAAGCFLQAAKECYKDESRRCACTLGQAWCMFLSGHCAEAYSIIDHLIFTVAYKANAPLHVMALELNIIMKTFLGDFDGADECMKLIRSLQSKSNSNSHFHHQNANNIPNDPDFQRKDNYSAPTCAIIAYFFVASDNVVTKNPYERAWPYALYACTKLSSRKQGFAFAGVLLFLATYAALEVLARIPGQNNHRELSSNDRKMKRFAFVKRKKKNVRSVMVSTESSGNRIHSGISSRFPKKKFVEVIKQSIRSLQMDSICCSCLSVLAEVLECKFLRTEDSVSLPVLKNRLEECILKHKSNNNDYENLPSLSFPTQPIKEKSKYFNLKTFTFAEAFIHMERAILCNHLGVSTDLKGVGDSSKIAKNSFKLLGGCPHKILLVDEIAPVIPPIFEYEPTTGDNSVVSHDDEELLQEFDDDEEIRNEITEMTGNEIMKPTSKLKDNTYLFKTGDLNMSSNRVSEILSSHQSNDSIACDNNSKTSLLFHRESNRIAVIQDTGVTKLLDDMFITNFEEKM